MIGCTTLTDNDVYIFFEGNDIDDLSKGKIQGSYINLEVPEISGMLEVEIREELSDHVLTEARRVDEAGSILQMVVFVRKRTYDAFKERRKFGDHQGYRKVQLLDATQLDFYTNSLYEQLKHYREQQNLRLTS